MTLSTAILGVIGLGFGLYQYYIAQKWRKSEFAARQLEMLDSNPELSLCCKFLDWSRRDLPVPEKYKAYTDNKTFEHNWTVLAEAMIPKRRKGRYTWQQAMYRDHFDRLCEYFQRLNHYLSIGLVTKSDIATVEYWLKELAKPRFLHNGDERMFIDFIRFFQYQGVLELMKKFGVVFNYPEFSTSEKVDRASMIE